MLSIYEILRSRHSLKIIGGDLHRALHLAWEAPKAATIFRRVLAKRKLRWEMRFPPDLAAGAGGMKENFSGGRFAPVTGFSKLRERGT